LCKRFAKKGKTKNYGQYEDYLHTLDTDSQNYPEQT
jgi:hypothetical protein